MGILDISKSLARLYTYYENVFALSYIIKMRGLLLFTVALNMPIFPLEIYGICFFVCLSTFYTLI